MTLGFFLSYRITTRMVPLFPRRTALEFTSTTVIDFITHHRLAVGLPGLSWSVTAEFPVNNGETICPWLSLPTPNIFKAISCQSFFPHWKLAFLFLSDCPLYFLFWSSQELDHPPWVLNHSSPDHFSGKRVLNLDDLSNLAFPNLTTSYTLYSPPVLCNRIPLVQKIKNKKSVCSLTWEITAQTLCLSWCFSPEISLLPIEKGLRPNTRQAACKWNMT